MSGLNVSQNVVYCSYLNPRSVYRITTNVFLFRRPPNKYDPPAFTHVLSVPVTNNITSDIIHSVHDSCNHLSVPTNARSSFETCACLGDASGSVEYTGGQESVRASHLEARPVIRLRRKKGLHKTAPCKTYQNEP
jgi:hypothetical protein